MNWQIIDAKTKSVVVETANEDDAHDIRDFFEDRYPDVAWKVIPKK